MLKCAQCFLPPLHCIAGMQQQNMGGLLDKAFSLKKKRLNQTQAPMFLNSPMGYGVCSIKLYVGPVPEWLWHVTPVTDTTHYEVVTPLTS